MNLVQLPQEEEATTQQDSTFSPEYFTLEEVRFLEEQIALLSQTAPLSYTKCHPLI